MKSQDDLEFALVSGSPLAQIAGEMAFGIEYALEGIAEAERLSQQDVGARGRVYRAALAEVRSLLRGAQEAKERYDKWWKDAAPDAAFVGPFDDVT